MSYDLWPTVLAMKSGRIIGDTLRGVGGQRLIMALYPRDTPGAIYPSVNSQVSYVSLPFQVLETSSDPGIGNRAYYVDITAVSQTQKLLVKGPIPPWLAVAQTLPVARAVERLPGRERIGVGDDEPVGEPAQPVERMLELD